MNRNSSSLMGGVARCTTSCLLGVLLGLLGCGQDTVKSNPMNKAKEEIEIDVVVLIEPRVEGTALMRVIDDAETS